MRFLHDFFDVEDSEYDLEVSEETMKKIRIAEKLKHYAGKGGVEVSPEVRKKVDSLLTVHGKKGTKKDPLGIINKQ